MIRQYKDLSPKEQPLANEITAFCYDLLNLWDAVITAKFYPLDIDYYGGSYDSLDHFGFASWTIGFLSSGEQFSMNFTIYPREIENPEYKRHIYRQVINAYVNAMYAERMKS